MNGELETMQKGSGRVLIEVLFRHFPGGTEENRAVVRTETNIFGIMMNLDSHRGDDEEYCYLLGSDGFQLDGSPPTFRRNILSDLRGLFPACSLLVACLTYPSTLKFQAIGSSETSVNFCWTTRHHIPEVLFIYFSGVIIKIVTPAYVAVDFCNRQPRKCDVVSKFRRNLLPAQNIYVAGSPESMLTIYQATRRHTPQQSGLHIHRHLPLYDTMTIYLFICLCITILYTEDWHTAVSSTILHRSSM